MGVDMAKKTAPRVTTENGSLAKCPTGIAGLDQLTAGGLPRGRIWAASSWCACLWPRRPSVRAPTRETTRRRRAPRVSAAALLLARLLSLWGHEVRVAHDGESALAAAVAAVPDVILLDLGMPGMDGYEVAGRIRQYPALRNVVLVALTGWGQEEDRHRTQHAGFDYHLIKPVDLDQLEAILRQVAT